MVSSPRRPSGTPASRGAGCGAHKSGSERGAPGQLGVPTRHPGEHGATRTLRAGVRRRVASLFCRVLQTRSDRHPPLMPENLVCVGVRFPSSVVVSDREGPGIVHPGRPRTLPTRTRTKAHLGAGPYRVRMPTTGRLRRPAACTGGFVKLRHYGLMSPSRATTRLDTPRALLHSQATEPSVPPSESGATPRGNLCNANWREVIRFLTGIDLGICPACGSRALLRLPLPPSATDARAPPKAA
jgi:hypothetical protein